MAQEKALVVGGAGQVGRQICSALAAKNGGKPPLSTSRTLREGWLRLNLAEVSESAQVSALLDPHPLDAIYCVGGMTYVDGCEAVPELAHRTNARGPGILATYAKRRKLPFVYFSTEYIFAGHADAPGPYAEGSEPNPLNVYGASKLAGERNVLQAHPEALVIRTTVVYGPDAQQKNFLYTVLRNLRAGKSMQVPADQVSTPTYNRDLVTATLGLVEAGASGIFHVCGPELLGRLEFARRFATIMRLDASLLHGASTASLNQPAQRPLSAGLAISKLTTLYPCFHMRPLVESIEDCGEELDRAFYHEPLST